MKIAITGANGFVGQALLKHFVEQGHEAIALIRKSAQIPSGAYAVCVLDYEDPSALKAALQDVDILVHNAGKTKSLNHSEMITANVGLTRKIISAVNSLDQSIQLIYISSQAASRPSSLNEFVKESDASQPVTSYGKSKAMAERLIRKQCQKPFTIVRPCSIYGPSDRDFLQLFRLCRYGMSLQIGKGKRQLNMIHASQLAEFILLLAGNPQAFGHTFFATDNQVYTQDYVAATICKAMGKGHRRIIVPQALAALVFSANGLFSQIRGKAAIVNQEKLAEVLAEAWLADTSKAKEMLAWDPESKLEHYIMETYQWYVQASWL